LNIEDKEHKVAAVKGMFYDREDKKGYIMSKYHEISEIDRIVYEFSYLKGLNNLMLIISCLSYDIDLLTDSVVV